MNKTVGDLHCPSPTDLGPEAPSLYPMIPPLMGSCHQCPLSSLSKKKSSVRGKILTLAIDTLHPGDITGHSQGNGSRQSRTGTETF